MTEHVARLGAENARLWAIVKRHNEECVPLWERQDLHVGHAQTSRAGEREFGLDMLDAEGPVEQDLAGPTLDALHPLDGRLIADGTLHASQYEAPKGRAVAGQTAHICVHYDRSHPRHNDGDGCAS